MRTTKELLCWVKEEIALAKNALQYYDNPNTAHIAEFSEMTNYSNELISNFEKIAIILENYNSFKNDLGEYTIQDINTMKEFCLNEKIKFTDAANENLKIKEQFYKAISNNDAASYYQDLEMLLIQLINLHS